MPVDVEHHAVTVHLGTLVVGKAPQPGQVGLVVGGVGDDQVAVAAEPVGQEVVEDAAVLIAEAGVLRPTDLDLGDVVGEHQLQKAQRSEPLDFDLPHMGDVEHPHVSPHRRVLLADPLVGDRHLPAGERHQLGAKRLVLLVERGASQGGNAHRPRVLEQPGGQGFRAQGSGAPRPKTVAQLGRPKGCGASELELSGEGHPIPGRAPVHQQIPPDEPNRARGTNQLQKPLLRGGLDM